MKVTPEWNFTLLEWICLGIVGGIMFPLIVGAAFMLLMFAVQCLARMVKVIYVFTTGDKYRL